MGVVLYVAMIVIAGGVVYFFSDSKKITPDNRTKELCQQYANRNHKGELAPERWQWFLEQGIDLNRDFDWYQSCIDHNATPVAK